MQDHGAGQVARPGRTPTARAAATWSRRRASRCCSTAATACSPSCAASVDYVDVDAVVISHLHADHFLDLVPFSYALTYAPRQQPVPVDRWPRHRIPPARSCTRRPARATCFRRVVGAWGERRPDRERLPPARVRPRARRLHVGPLTLRFQPVPHFVPTNAVELIARTAPGGSPSAPTARPTTSCARSRAGTDLLLIEATLPRPERAGARGHLTPARGRRARPPRGRRRLVITHFSDELDADWARAGGRAGVRRARRGRPARAPSTTSERGRASGRATADKGPYANPVTEPMSTRRHDHGRRATLVAPSVRALQGRAPGDRAGRGRHRRRGPQARRPGWDERLKTLLQALSQSERACLFAVRLADEQALPLPAETLLDRARTDWFPEFLSHGLMRPHFQPIVELATGRSYRPRGADARQARRRRGARRRAARRRRGARRAVLLRLPRPRRGARDRAAADARGRDPVRQPRPARRRSTSSPRCARPGRWSAGSTPTPRGSASSSCARSAAPTARCSRTLVAAAPQARRADRARRPLRRHRLARLPRAAASPTSPRSTTRSPPGSSTPTAAAGSSPRSSSAPTSAARAWSPRASSASASSRRCATSASTSARASTSASRPSGRWRSTRGSSARGPDSSETRERPPRGRGRRIDSPTSASRSISAAGSSRPATT